VQLTHEKRLLIFVLVWKNTAKMGISDRLSQNMLDRSWPNFQLW